MHQQISSETMRAYRNFYRIQTLLIMEIILFRGPSYFIWYVKNNVDAVLTQFIIPCYYLNEMLCRQDSYF